MKNELNIYEFALNRADIRSSTLIRFVVLFYFRKLNSLHGIFYFQDVSQINEPILIDRAFPSLNSFARRGLPIILISIGCKVRNRYV